MKKFEEEIFGKVETMITQPGCSMTRKVWYSAGDIHDFSEGWVSPEEHQSEIDQLKSQLEKQQPEIPEVPQFMDEWFKSDNLENLIDVWYNHTADLPENVKDYLDSLGEDITTSEYCYKEIVHLIARAKLDGCTVKEKRFYLKNKLTGLYLYKGICGEYGEEYPTGFSESFQFTQSEIDSMETGSYEQIEVQE